MIQNSIPIYYLVVENVDLQSQYFGYRIIQCIPCNLSDIDRLYREVFLPILNGGTYRATTIIFAREPDNPFREMTKEDGKTEGAKPPLDYGLPGLGARVIDGR